MTNNLSKIFYITDYKQLIFQIFCALTFWLPLAALAQPAIPCGHSHNDYLKERPLYEAVELGFGSIEIDVCLDKNHQVKVAHNPWMLDKKPTIEALYLEPLKKMIESKDSIFKYTSASPLTLMIDIKTGADSTWHYLQKILAPYHSYLTQYKNGHTIYAAPVKICISGHRPHLENDDPGYARLDAGLHKVWDKDTGFVDIPWVERASAPYADFLNNAVINQYNKTKSSPLLSHINKLQAHRIGVRFYAAPNNKKVWKFMLDIGLEWINVDQLKKFSEFYHAYKKGTE